MCLYHKPVIQHNEVFICRKLARMSDHVPVNYSRAVATNAELKLKGERKRDRKNERREREPEREREREESENGE